MKLRQVEVAEWLEVAELEEIMSEEIISSVERDQAHAEWKALDQSKDWSDWEVADDLGRALEVYDKKYGGW
jgi:hypothetical protein